MRLKGLHSCMLQISCIFLSYNVKSICTHIIVILNFKLCSGADKCYNRTLCDELLSILLPAKPPFHPRQFATCAVVGNSGDLLKTEFGQEIDAHDAVFRDNEAPVNKVNTMDNSSNISKLRLCRREWFRYTGRLLPLTSLFIHSASQISYFLISAYCFLPASVFSMSCLETSLFSICRNMQNMLD